MQRKTKSNARKLPNSKSKTKDADEWHSMVLNRISKITRPPYALATQFYLLKILQYILLKYQIKKKTKNQETFLNRLIKHYFPYTHVLSTITVFGTSWSKEKDKAQPPSVWPFYPNAPVH